MNNPDEEQLQENEDENFKSKDAGASKKDTNDPLESQHSKEVNDLMEAKAVNDLLESPEMKELDDLLTNSDEKDQYHTEIFDTLM